MQGVGTLPPDSPTTNNQQSPNNNVVLPPKPLNLSQPASFRQKKPPMPSPPQTGRMDAEVSACLTRMYTFYVHMFFWGKFNSFCCAYVLLFMFRWDQVFFLKKKFLFLINLYKVRIYRKHKHGFGLVGHIFVVSFVIWFCDIESQRVCASIG